jgi:hypothetical protein
MNNQILMTRDNPKGFKLEDLTKKLCFEIKAKSFHISGDTSIEAQTIVSNNAQIVGLLYQVEAKQNHSLIVLSTIRKDEGPNGKARL